MQKNDFERNHDKFLNNSVSSKTCIWSKNKKQKDMQHVTNERTRNDFLSKSTLVKQGYETDSPQIIALIG